MKYSKFKGKSTLIIVFAAFVGLNLLAALAFSHVRIDLTENHLNTLSEGTRNILQNLEKPVTLRYYVSKAALENVPSLSAYAKQVERLVDEYAVLGNGKVTVEKIDPLPFSEEEDDAVSAGLQGVMISEGETLYFGLVAQSDGASQVIPFFQTEREQFLEYDLSQAIYAVTHPKKKVVGVLSALPLQGSYLPGQGMGAPVMLFEQLRKQFTVRYLPTADTAVPDDVDVLVVVKPGGLSDQALYAIDQYMLRGGKALVFADPLSEAQAQPYGQPPAESPKADELLAKWGVHMISGKVVGDPGLAQQVSYRNAYGAMQTARYLPWLALGPKQYNHDEILVSQLGNINIASAGALEKLDGSKSTFVPLIKTSAQAGLINKDQLSFNVDPAGLFAGFKPGNEPYVLAARIKGKFQTAFPDGPPQDANKKTEKAKEPEAGKEQLTESVKPANLVIVADSDLLQDRFWVQVNNFFGQQVVVPKAANLDFVTNALEILGGSPNLISVRSRGSYYRPFELVAEIQQDAELQYRAKEQELRQKLEATEQKLNELQRQRQDAASPELTAEQQQELDKFVQEKVKTRKKLREVQYQLRANIEDLERTLKILNIGLMPLMISLVAFIAWVIRRQRERGF